MGEWGVNDRFWKGFAKYGHKRTTFGSSACPELCKITDWVNNNNSGDYRLLEYTKCKRNRIGWTCITGLEFWPVLSYDLLAEDSVAFYITAHRLVNPIRRAELGKSWGITYTRAQNRACTKALSSDFFRRVKVIVDRDDSAGSTP